MFYRKRKKFLPLNKDIADEGGDFAILSLFEEEEKIFEKLNKKEQRSFELLNFFQEYFEVVKKYFLTIFLFFGWRYQNFC